MANYWSANLSYQSAKLFKDITASQVHAQTSLGNDPKKPKKKPAAKPDPDNAPQVDVNKYFGSTLESFLKEQGIFEEADSAARKRVEQFAKATLVKVDESLGLVFGFAIVSKKDGEDYFDLQGDNIPEDAMLKASLDFMENSRVAKEMHTGDEAGSVVFAFPLTSDIASALEITTKQTGLLIAMRPAEGMLAKFKSGEFTGFSIGGYRLVDEEA